MRTMAQNLRYIGIDLRGIFGDWLVAKGLDIIPDSPAKMHLMQGFVWYLEESRQEIRNRKQ